MANSVTNPRNNELKDICFALSKMNYAHGGSSVSFDYQQGDLLYWDSVAKYVKPLDSDAHSAFLVGVAQRSAYIAPYGNAQQSGGPALLKNYHDSALVGFGGIFTFFSTSAESYSDGDVVYWGNVANNPQIISKSSGSPTHAVGVVKLNPANASAIAGGATVLVPVLVIPQIPVQTL